MLQPESTEDLTVEQQQDDVEIEDTYEQSDAFAVSDGNKW